MTPACIDDFRLLAEARMKDLLTRAKALGVETLVLAVAMALTGQIDVKTLSPDVLLR